MEIRTLLRYTKDQQTLESLKDPKQNYEMRGEKEKMIPSP